MQQPAQKEVNQTAPSGVSCETRALPSIVGRGDGTASSCTVASELTITMLPGTLPRPNGLTGHGQEKNGGTLVGTAALLRLLQESPISFILDVSTAWLKPIQNQSREQLSQKGRCRSSISASIISFEDHAALLVVHDKAVQIISGWRASSRTRAVGLNIDGVNP